MVVTKLISPIERIPVVYHGIPEVVSGYWWIRNEEDRWIKRGHKTAIVEVTHKGNLYEQLEQYGPR